MRVTFLCQNKIFFRVKTTRRFSQTSRFTFSSSRGGWEGTLKKNGFCGELGEKKCLPLPMNRVIFFKITDDGHLD